MAAAPASGGASSTRTGMATVPGLRVPEGGGVGAARPRARPIVIDAVACERLRGPEKAWDGIVVFRHNGTEVARTAASKVSPQGDASWSQTIDMDGRGLSPAEVLLDVRARGSRSTVATFRLPLWRVSEERRDIRLHVIGRPRRPGELLVVRVHCPTAAHFAPTALMEAYPVLRNYPTIALPAGEAGLSDGAASESKEGETARAVSCLASTEVILHIVPDVTAVAREHGANAAQAGHLVVTDRRLIHFPFSTAQEERHRVRPSAEQGLRGLRGRFPDGIIHIPTAALASVQSGNALELLDRPLAALHATTRDCLSVSFLFESISSRPRPGRGSGQQRTERALGAVLREVVWQLAEFDCAQRLSHAVRGGLHSANAGWEAADVRREWARLGIDDTPVWQSTHLNEDFDLCPTYARHIVVPGALSDEQLRAAARYRTKNRIPCLSWLHPVSGVPMCRSSQPRTGMTGASNDADVVLLAAILDSAVLADFAGVAEAPIRSRPRLPPRGRRRRTVAAGEVLRVLDARPAINATGNRFKGGGPENLSAYVGRDSRFVTGALPQQLDSRRASVAAPSRESAVSDGEGGGSSEAAKLSSSAPPATSGIELMDVAFASRETEADETSAGGAEASQPAPQEGASRRSSAAAAALQRAAIPDDLGWVRLEFLGIANIHSMRGSIVSMMAASAGDDDRWAGSVYASSWLQHISAIITGAMRAAYLLNSGEPVLVHCSDGWDRTAQLSALAQFIIDPYYRTIDGFAVLVEKEWCAAGHKLHDRCIAPGPAHKAAAAQAAGRSVAGVDVWGEHELSPVFLQFLDCVWQLMQQFPASTEFSEDLLLFLATHVHSGWFGTFLYNCERERVADHVYGRTLSVWSVVSANRRHFQNPGYSGHISGAIPTEGAGGASPTVEGQAKAVEGTGDAAAAAALTKREVRLLGPVELKALRVWPQLFLGRSAPPAQDRRDTAAASSASTDPDTWTTELAEAHRLSAGLAAERDRLSAQLAAQSRRVAALQLTAAAEPRKGRHTCGGGCCSIQ